MPRRPSEEKYAGRGSSSPWTWGGGRRRIKEQGGKRGGGEPQLPEAVAAASTAHLRK